MSYCRGNDRDSDVYVIGTRNLLECFGAGWWLEREKPLHDRIEVPDWTTENGYLVRLETTHESHASFTTTSRQGMINHLLAHRAAGHRVPDRALRRLRAEIEEEGDSYV